MGLSWAIALGALAGALVLPLALEAYLDDSAAFMALFGAVAIAVWLLGARAASGFALVGYVAYLLLFVEPRYGLSFGDPRTLIEVLAYVLACAFIIAIGETVQAARDHAHARGELLRVTLGSIDDAVIATDIDSTITYLNESAEKLTGWSCGEALGHPLDSVFRLVNDDDCGAGGTETLRASRARRPGGVAHRAVLLDRDGVTRPVEHSVAPIKGSDGLIAGCVLTFRDISAKQRLERDEMQRAELREAAAASERLQAYFDQSPIFAAIMQTNGTVLEPSRHSFESCGYRRSQIAGLPLWEAPWWSRSLMLIEQIRDACEQAARGQAFRAELPYYVRDGKERFADLSIVGITDDAGQMLFLALTAIDITDRKRAENERRKLISLAENSADFISMCNPDLEPVYVNPAGLALAGLESMQEAQRRHVLDFIAPEDRERITREFLPQVMREGHGVTELRLRNLRTGEIRWMDYKAFGLRDALGRKSGYATVSRDITERRALEERLRTLAAGVCEAERRKSALLATLADELLALADKLVTMHCGRVTAESAGEGMGARFIVRLPIEQGSAPARTPTATSAPERKRR